MSAHQQERPKKSFEFRMSKKVAELTQVVHMLFTRNHEKEVEIDALKKSYEKEIDFVIEDAKEKIANLERTVSSVNKKADVEIENFRKSQQGEIASVEGEWRQKLAENEEQLQEERTECQNLRDLLINAQRDIEKLRQGVTDELSSKSDEVRKRDKEIDRLRVQLSSTEIELKSSQKDAQNVIVELERANTRLEEELRQLRSVMENSHKTRDQVLTRNKQLEQDMKTLKREFNKRATEFANNQLKNARNNLTFEANEELERLRREVQRYRLELSNRDANFNRMFTDKQPVLLNQRSNSSSKNNNSAVYTSYSTGIPQSAGHVLRTGAGNAISNSSQNPAMQNLLQERQSTKNGFIDNSKTLERQMTFSERISMSQERVFQNANGTSEQRPQTHGHGFSNERLLSQDRTHNIIKQQLSPIFQNDPSQLMPQRSGTMFPDRPTSSSLPSICSTPERRPSKQLSKPKPLPREMLYGK